MSWDVSLICDGHEDVDCGNYTSNVAPMYKKALGISFRDIDGQLASGVALTLTHGIIEMTSNPRVYRNMNPENGWGNYEGALWFLAKIIRECLFYPEFKVKVE